MASHLLNDAQIDHYQRTGYVIPDFRLSEDNLMQIKATHARLVEHPGQNVHIPNRQTRPRQPIYATNQRNHSTAQAINIISQRHLVNDYLALMLRKSMRIMLLKSQVAST